MTVGAILDRTPDDRFPGGSVVGSRRPLPGRARAPHRRDGDRPLAHDLRHDRQVAIKVVKPEVVVTVGAERFIAEIRTTAHLKHPHILPLFDSGAADGLPFYVIPLVHGRSLPSRL